MKMEKKMKMKKGRTGQVLFAVRRRKKKEKKKRKEKKKEKEKKRRKKKRPASRVNRS